MIVKQRNACEWQIDKSLMTKIQFVSQGEKTGILKPIQPQTQCQAIQLN